MFSQVCVCSTFRGGGGGTPSQVWPGGGIPSKVQVGRGTPSQVQAGGGVPHPRSGWGVPHSADRGYPIPGLVGRIPHSADGDTLGTPAIQIWMGYPPSRPGTIFWPSKIGSVPPHPDLGWGGTPGTPHPRLDRVPPVQTWDQGGTPGTSQKAKRALTTRWAVCLLRSRRRTFFFSIQTVLWIQKFSKRVTKHINLYNCSQRPSSSLLLYFIFFLRGGLV